MKPFLTLCLLLLAAAAVAPVLDAGCLAEEATADAAKANVTGESEKPKEETASAAGEEGPVAPAIDYMKQVPPADPVLAAKVTDLAGKLVTGSSTSRTGALKGLLDLADPIVIPYLIPALALEGEEEDQVRMQIMGGIMEKFPSVAADVLIQLIEKGKPPQRIAAAYAFGRLLHPRQPEVLCKHIFDDNKELRYAAISALTYPGTLVKNYYQNFALQKYLQRDTPLSDPPHDIIGQVNKIVAAVVAEITGRDLTVMEDPFMVIRKEGTHETALTLLRHFQNGLSAEQKPVGEIIARMMNANSHWAGRAVPLDAELVEYEIWMMNLKANNEKSYPIMFDAPALAALRGLGTPQHLDRGIVLDLMLDELLIYPQVCHPSIQETNEREIVLEYRVPLFAPELKCGLGSLGLMYWAGSISGIAKSVLRVERERAVPLEETIYDAEGEKLAIVTYGEYQKLGDGTWVPGKMNLNMMAVRYGKGTRHMKYDLEFQVKQGVWLLKEATANEQVDGSDTPRALAELRNVQIISKKDSAKPEPASAPDAPKEPVTQPKETTPGPGGGG